jgi:hypothetical protein
MAATIRFTDAQALKEGMALFLRHGDAVPTGEPETYYVTDRIVELLAHEHIPFEAIEPEQYGLLRVTEAMFADLRQATAQANQGKVLQVIDPKSLEDIVSAGEEQD